MTFGFKKAAPQDGKSNAKI